LIFSGISHSSPSRHRCFHKLPRDKYSGRRRAPNFKRSSRISEWTGMPQAESSSLLISIKKVSLTCYNIYMYICYKFYTDTTILFVFFFFLKINFSSLLDVFKLGKKLTENIYTVKRSFQLYAWMC